MTRFVACIVAIAALIALSPPAFAQDDFSFGRRIYLQKAECTFCHGWAGDGAGQPQSPGKAANLRQSRLNREQLVMVIGCGIPGTAMPPFVDHAYSDRRCYGLPAEEVGAKVPTLPPSSTVDKRAIEVLADYLLARVIGRGPISREECQEGYGARAQSCNEYPPKG